MREIVKILLEKGIDEETIHEVLNILEEGVDIPDFMKHDQEHKQAKRTIKRYEDAQKAKGAAKNFSKDAITALRQSVRGKKVAGPIVR